MVIHCDVMTVRRLCDAWRDKRKYLAHRLAAPTLIFSWRWTANFSEPAPFGADIVFSGVDVVV